MILLAEGDFISNSSSGALAVAYNSAHFGQGTGPIVLDDVHCSSTIHRRLLDCPHRGIHTHNCRHNKDAGVSCPPCMILLITVS